MCFQRTQDSALHDCKATLSLVLDTSLIPVQSERAIADEAAAQMAAQAQALLAERARMAAKLAEQERENRQLLERLKYMEAFAHRAADDGEDAPVEEDDGLRDLLA